MSTQKKEDDLGEMSKRCWAAAGVKGWQFNRNVSFFGINVNHHKDLERAGQERMPEHRETLTAQVSEVCSTLNQEQWVQQLLSAFVVASRQWLDKPLVVKREHLTIAHDSDAENFTREHRTLFDNSGEGSRTPELPPAKGALANHN